MRFFNKRLDYHHLEVASTIGTHRALKACVRCACKAGGLPACELALTAECVQELRQLLEEQADQLEVAVGAKKSTDRVLKRSDSSLHEATEKIKVSTLP